MRVYLDIDGVLLSKKLTRPHGAEAFISFLITHFDCFWLTTHCRHNTNMAVRYLAQFYGHETVKLLTQVKPTNWTDLKTEAIEFKRDFIWLEDAPLEAEKRVLGIHNALNALWLINLQNDHELTGVQSRLKGLL